MAAGRRLTPPAAGSRPPAGGQLDRDRQGQPRPVRVAGRLPVERGPDASLHLVRLAQDQRRRCAPCRRSARPTGRPRRRPGGRTRPCAPRRRPAGPGEQRGERVVGARTGRTVARPAGPVVAARRPPRSRRRGRRPAGTLRHVPGGQGQPAGRCQHPRELAHRRGRLGQVVHQEVADDGVEGSRSANGSASADATPEVQVGVGRGPGRPSSGRCRRRPGGRPGRPPRPARSRDRRPRRGPGCRHRPRRRRAGASTTRAGDPPEPPVVSGRRAFQPARRSEVRARTSP